MNGKRPRNHSGQLARGAFPMVRTFPRSAVSAVAVATGVVLTLTGVATLPASAAGPTISIDDPAAAGPLRAGEVALTGQVFRGTSQTTTVLYAVDATDSTALPAGSDCDGDGAVTPADDLNGDGSTGDTLDCEISAVRALDGQLAATAGGGLQVGLLAFANLAVAADLSPEGTTFVPPGFTGGDAAPRVVTAAASVTRNQIGRFNVKDLGGSGEGTAFDNAVQASLATLGQAPPGPKWVMLLSDGAAPLADSTVASLQAAARDSGVRLRSFAIGGAASCSPGGGLAKMAAATGETCVDVANPASLAASLQGSQPESITGVTVTVGGVSFAADVNPVGGWRAALRLGKGSYTATVTATLSSGARVSAQRAFSVADAPAGTVAPPPGSVGGAGGTLLASQVSVTRPKPSRARLPKRVAGSVGTPGKTPKATKRLNGATVLLQGRAGAGSPWVTVGRSTVAASDFAVKWKRKKTIRSLRVQLQPHGGFASSVAAVRVAKISDCKRDNGKGKSWKLTCHTTAKKRTPARLQDGKRLVDRAKVTKKGLVTVEGTGKIGRYVLYIDVSKKTTLKLSL